MGYTGRLVRRARIEAAQVRVKLGRSARDANHEQADVLVALTTYPARVSAAVLAIRSILQQRVQPQRIIVVLAEDEFPGRAVPARLMPLTADGIEILWVSHNSRSYKKLVPVRERFPRATIVTADDDMLYPRWWLGRLVEASNRDRGSIVGYRGQHITFDAEGKQRPYLEWANATRSTPSREVLLTGAGGILYPPGSLHQDAFDLNLAEKLAPTADDIWFRIGAYRMQTPVKVVDDRFHEFPEVRGSVNTGLARTNVESMQNDAQLEACMQHFRLPSLLTMNV
jgi:hypothetical protein